MATENSVQYAAKLAGSLLDGRINGGKLEVYRFDVPLAAQASGDTINLGHLPRDHQFVAGALVSDTSLSTATLGIGIAGSSVKYRPQSVFTTVDVPVLFGPTAAVIEAERVTGQDLIATVGTAALPSTGNLAVIILASAP